MFYFVEKSIFFCAHYDICDPYRNLTFHICMTEELFIENVSSRKKKVFTEINQCTISTGFITLFRQSPLVRCAPLFSRSCKIFTFLSS